MSPRLRTALVTGAVAVFGIVLAALVWNAGSRPVELTLDDYLGRLAAGRVSTATVRDAANRVDGTLEDGRTYTVPYPAEYSDELTSQVTGAPNDVEIVVATAPEGALGRAVGWVGTALPYLVLAAAVGFVVYMAWGDRGSLWRRISRRRHRATSTDIRYSDVAGLEDAVEEMGELLEFVGDPQRYLELGARIPKGVILVGPPGSGKTLLARATAGEAGVPLYTVSGSDFVDMYVGAGAGRMRELFGAARANAPAIVFIDDVESVGRRTAGEDPAARERERTLNQLLAEMDAIDNESGLVVIAATNRPDVLDRALFRRGRFDRRVSIDLPDVEGRLQILELHTRRMPIASDVDLEAVARHTAGFSGADLANVVNEAALLSARAGRQLVAARWFEEAVDRVLAGPERAGRIPSDDERRTTAVHEAGHAVVAKAMISVGPLHKVSIVGRDRALGLTVTAPDDERELRTRSELMEGLVVLLAGRAAETIVFGEPSNAGADDIGRATGIARQMACEFGMSETLGPRRIVRPEIDDPENNSISETLAALADEEISRLLGEASSRAMSTVMSHREIVEQLAEELLAHETVRGAELDQLLSGVDRVPDIPSRARGRNIEDESGVLDDKQVPLPNFLREAEVSPEQREDRG